MSNTPEIIHLKEEQIPAIGKILSQSFFNDPIDVYTLPDPEPRLNLFAWVFEALVRDSFPLGHTYTTIGGDGVAVWLPPQTGEAQPEMGHELEQIEEHLGREAALRFTDTFAYLEDVHHQYMHDPHWYLQLLGVASYRQSQGIGGALIAPILAQADREGTPCYLETFVASNVPFYERRGFKILTSGEEPKSKVPYWAMRRDPQAGR
ncbi:N-acetyltransferase [Dictyobacter alpinus]|uniref:N-acetyltransferase n=1 Tax=Dictyobacter alpinus TaxID=2014873 RepID=A0A402BHX7_9CHLR|nr:GNAT family N-acetyltransferase [Dictyobacter alpinus]GCE30936.1 N-acetyltransferase [Dictyobacter alpinus]